ncbi:glycosyltransferase [Patescibacteria group bacterium]|nr:glycosyltransferase [Patescibacteria group bacterium]
MKVLMISRDRKIGDRNSEVAMRIASYGKFVEELYIIVFSKGGFQDQHFNNIFLYATNSRSKWFYIFDAYRIAKRVIRQHHLEVRNSLITCQDPFETGAVGYFLKRKFHIPLQLQIHVDFLHPYFKKDSFFDRMRVLMARFLLPHADGVRVVHRRIAESLKAKSYRLKSEPIILPIFIDIEKIRSTIPSFDLHQKYHEYNFIILMVSRLVLPQKNITLAIKSMSEVIKRHPKTLLLIVGDGPARNYLESMIKDYGLEDNIKIERWTNNVVSYYKTTDLFLLTSHYEGYGMTLVEAAAAGCNILSTDVGIAHDILPEENIFDMDSIRDLEEKLLKAIKGELLPSNPLKFITKENYLQRYKESWQNCL